jgi:aspartate/methionine/tyrosine aminotransferase
VFSRRVPPDLQDNALTRAVTAVRDSGRPLLDLTVTNPTLVGLDYPADLSAVLARATVATYQPRPFGLPAARAAVARDFVRRGLDVSAERVVLVASTSEAYSWLFKLLCDPADEVLIPEPSYPLFGHLTALDAVRGVPYRLEYQGCWSIDRESVARAWSARTRAAVVVSPNNPTGSLLRADDLAWLVAQCASRQVALISDEVFADYPLAPGRDAVTSALPTMRSGSGTATLTAALGGLSKSAGLPQMKVSWFALDGPPAVVDESLQRLELIADTYLSVGTPAQQALGELLEAGGAIRAAIARRVAANHATLARIAASHPACDALRVEGGWSAVVRLPASRPEDVLVETLLVRDGVLVHPGYFFDFPHEAFVVVSLLTDPGVFSEGVERLCRLAIE